MRVVSSRWSVVIVAAVLALALSGCDWSGFRHDLAHSGFNPETSRSTSTTHGVLQRKFTAATDGAVNSSPAVVNGVVYVGSNDGKFYAFDAAGTTNCGNFPKSCTPLWTATTTGQAFTSSPFVANGVVYIGSDDGFVYAFDTAGKTNCSGVPKTCHPLRSYRSASPVRSSPMIGNGVLYIGAAADTIEAFDANGATNCSGAPKVCAPLWVGSPPQVAGSEVSTPAIGNGRVYVSAPDGNMYVFDADGVTNCAGAPKVCAPLWTDETGRTGALNSSPAIDTDFVYVGSSTQDLYAFDVNGSLRCTGEFPVTCAPVFTDVMFVGTSSSPAIANGLVFVGGNDGNLHAFSANDFTFCVHGPNICPQVWDASVGSSIDLSSPAVADGVVYIGGGQNVASFDATTGRPLSIVTTGGAVESSPAVANGMVYVGSGDGRLYAFGTA